MSEVRLIDANELKERLLVLRNNITNIQCISDIFDICLTEVSNAPTVDPYDICKGVIIGNYALGFHLGWEKAKERPKGEIFPMELVAGKCPIEVGGNCPLKSQGEWKCPECGEWLFACPNCGADMRQNNEPNKQITIEEYMQSLKGENQ